MKKILEKQEYKVSHTLAAALNATLLDIPDYGNRIGVQILTSLIFLKSSSASPYSASAGLTAVAFAIASGVQSLPTDILGVENVCSFVGTFAHNVGGTTNPADYPQFPEMIQTGRVVKSTELYLYGYQDNLGAPTGVIADCRIIFDVFQLTQTEYLDLLE